MVVFKISHIAKRSLPNFKNFLEFSNGVVYNLFFLVKNGINLSFFILLYAIHRMINDFLAIQTCVVVRMELAD